MSTIVPVTRRARSAGPAWPRPTPRRRKSFMRASWPAGRGRAGRRRGHLGRGVLAQHFRLVQRAAELVGVNVRQRVDDVERVQRDCARSVADEHGRGRSLPQTRRDSAQGATRGVIQLRSAPGRYTLVHAGTPTQKPCGARWPSGQSVGVHTQRRTPCPSRSSRRSTGAATDAAPRIMARCTARAVGSRCARARLRSLAASGWPASAWRLAKPRRMRRVGTACRPRRRRRLR